MPSARVRPKPNRAPFIKPHPIVVIASSILTTIKSTWYTVREKRAAKTLKTEIDSTVDILRRAHVNRMLLNGEFDYYFARLIYAIAYNDGRYARQASQLRHLRIFSCYGGEDPCRVLGHAETPDDH